MTPHEPVDSAINEAASRLTSAKPSDAFRSNVMSRIAVTQPSRFAWRYVFAGGAMASVALAAFVSWPNNPTISNLTIANPTVINPAVISSTIAAHPTAVKNASSPLTSIARTVAATDGEQSVLAALSDTDPEWSSRMVPALEQAEPMTIRPLSGAPIKAIDIDPIRLAPLVVSAIGNNQQ